MQREIRQLPVLNSFLLTLYEKPIYPGFRNIESDFIKTIVERLRNLTLLPGSHPFSAEGAQYDSQGQSAEQSEARRPW